MSWAKADQCLYIDGKISMDEIQLLRNKGHGLHEAKAIMREDRMLNLIEKLEHDGEISITLKEVLSDLATI